MIKILFPKVISDIYRDTFNSNLHSEPVLILWHFLVKVAVNDHPQPANQNLAGWLTAAAGYCALQDVTPAMGGM